MESKQTFERMADSTLERCRDLYKERGEQYSDTWAIDNLVLTLTKAIFAKFGWAWGKPEQLRIVLAAALADVKDSRLQGDGSVADSLEDGINYRAVLNQMLKEYEANDIPGIILPTSPTIIWKNPPTERTAC